MLTDLSSGFIEFKKDEVLALIKSRIEKGDEALQILDDAHIAMIAVGKKFQEGDIYLGEMLLAAEIFKEVLALLEPQLVLARSPEPHGSVLLATPRGDIHDLGKNIFATLLSSQGFKVYDLGVDVDPQLVLDKVKEVKPDFVGFSALITTSFASMKQLTDIFEKEALRSGFKLMVGGGVTTPILKDHIGADFQSTNAMDGVNYCLKVMAEKTSQSSV